MEAVNLISSHKYSEKQIVRVIIVVEIREISQITFRDTWLLPFSCMKTPTFYDSWSIL